MGGQRWRQLAQLHLAPLAFAAACGVTALAFALPLRAIHTPPLLLVATCLGAAGFVFLLGISLVHHQLRRTGAPAPEWLWLLAQWAAARRKLRQRLGRAPATAR